MSISLQRDAAIQTIYECERGQLFNAAVDHLAIPMIGGMSMDEITQQQFEMMGGKGKKPEPLSSETKQTIYLRIRDFYKPKLLQKITDILQPSLSAKLISLSDSELETKAQQLKAKITTNHSPDWSKLPALFKEHTLLFKELKTFTTIDPVAVHDALCPILSYYRDTNELYDAIHWNDFF